MFHHIKEIASSVGNIVMSLPAAARIANDVEIGRHPNEDDLRTLGLPTDINLK
ncbi:hypothetical protein [Cohaesibacter celericrescens]|jgi:hypothetical protein|uniref:hypothetical protein n=1 Tax=Cohaesibacter celericrescens TaxID=2067669 RepID=UPI0015E1185C|nr:hypothetical protein [Cohaesibacter celericrescens]